MHMPVDNVEAILVDSIVIMIIKDAYSYIRNCKYSIHNEISE